MKLSLVVMLLMAAVVACSADDQATAVVVERDNVNARTVPTFTDCAPFSTYFHWNDFNLTPATPVRGEALTVTVSGELKERVTGGTVSIYIGYGYVPFLETTEDLCTVDDGDNICPVEPSAFSESDTFVVPPDLPPGTYNIQVSAKDENLEDIVCVKLTVVF
jgi:ML domain